MTIGSERVTLINMLNVVELVRAGYWMRKSVFSMNSCFQLEALLKYFVI